jgi:hypothetical protein
MSNATASTPNKTVIEVTNDSHQRLRDGASKTGNSMKRFTALILEYALGKFENGEIGLREPVIEEVPQTEEAGGAAA